MDKNSIHTIVNIDDLFADTKLKQKLDNREIINAEEFLVPNLYEDHGHNSSFITEPVNIEIRRFQSKSRGEPN
jgi:hypothetical protein